MVGPSSVPSVVSFTQALTLSAMDTAAEASSLLGHYPEGLASPLSGLYCPRVYEVFAPTRISGR